MRWRDVGSLALFHLHVACGGNLASVIIRMIDSGLEPHLFAVRATDGTLSIAILGLDKDGVSRSYAEVVLTDLDPVSRAAWAVLKADDVIARARARLVEVDAILNGKSLPERGAGKVS